MKDFSWGPIVATVIAIGGMMFMFVLGYLMGYNDAKDGK